MYFIVLSSLIFLITILISVAFFTVFERKILGYVHFRLGPNKNAIIGIGQPFNDLMKLFGKKDYKFSLTNSFLFNISPLLMVVFSMVLWMLFSHWGSSLYIKNFFIILMIMNGISTFFFLFPGWGSGSFYSNLGGYRSSAQSISYEGIFFFAIICFMMFLFNFSTMGMEETKTFSESLITMILLVFPWLLSIMAESNRTPFDFAEGESELVSGFNTEYGSGMFSIIFLSEYMNMLFLSFLTSWLLVNTTSFFFIFFMFTVFTYIWMRTCFPRLRYDKLMVMAWKSMMFFITSVFMLYLFFCFF